MKRFITGNAATTNPSGKPCKKNLPNYTYKPEKQGEAIGFTLDGKGYYTTSEGVFAPIYYYNIPNN